MKHHLNTFLMQFISAYKGEHQYLVARKTGKSLALAALFQRLGLIRAICTQPEFYRTNKNNLVKASRKYFDEYMVVWLSVTPHTVTGSAPGQPQHHRLQHRSMPFHRMEVQVKPSHRTNNRLSYKQLRDSVEGRGNVLHILETPRGFLTASEAVRLQVGGFIICTLHL